MSNDPIRDVSAAEAWQAVQKSNNGGEDGGFGAQKGHDDDIEDVVAIQADLEIIERLKSATRTEEVIAILPHEKRIEEEQSNQHNSQKEKILEYLKLPGERLDEDYVFEAARAAMFELLGESKGDLTDHEKALATFTTLFAQKIKEKELSPVNNPDKEGTSTIEIESEE